MFGSMQLDTYYKGHSKNFFFRVAIKKLMRVPRVLVYNFVFNHLFEGSHVELEFQRLEFHSNKFEDGKGEKEKKRRKRRFGSKEEEEEDDLEKLDLKKMSDHR